MRVRPREPVPLALCLRPEERIESFSDKTQALEGIVFTNSHFNHGTVSGMIIPILPISM